MTLFSIETLCDGIFCYDRFSGTSMRRNKDTFVPLYRIHRHPLKWIQFELVFTIRLCRRAVLGYRSVVIARGYWVLPLGGEPIKAWMSINLRAWKEILAWCLSSSRGPAVPIKPALDATPCLAFVSKARPGRRYPRIFGYRRCCAIHVHVGVITIMTIGGLPINRYVFANLKRRAVLFHGFLVVDFVVFCGIVET
jgi:hypothetical protein